MKKLNEKKSKILSENLNTLMVTHKTNSHELALALKLPYNTIKRILDGVTTDPRLSTLKAISDHFNITIDRLTDSVNQALSEKIEHLTIKSIPILEWEDITTPNPLNCLNLNDWENWLPVALESNQNFGEQIYAIKSRKSMYARFPSGTRFIIDPTTKPIDGDLVLIQIKESAQITLREYIVDYPEIVLESITTGGKSIQFDSEQHDVFGVVIMTLISKS
jgi:transcriptional regulator with XRE-family HTH domain